VTSARVVSNQKQQTQPQQQQRGRGRPPLPYRTVRIETVVPEQVMQLLIQREREGHGYRTRIACRILCEWTSKTTGKPIRYH